MHAQRLALLGREDGPGRLGSGRRLGRRPRDDALLLDLRRQPIERGGGGNDQGHGAERRQRQPQDARRRSGCFDPLGRARRAGWAGPERSSRRVVEDSVPSVESQPYNGRTDSKASVKYESPGTRPRARSAAAAAANSGRGPGNGAMPRGRARRRRRKGLPRRRAARPSAARTAARPRRSNRASRARAPLRAGKLWAAVVTTAGASSGRADVRSASRDAAVGGE